MLEPCAVILRGNKLGGVRRSQLGSPGEREVRVGEQRAAQQDDISLAGGENALGLRSRGNHADGPDRQSAFAHARRKCHLISGTHGDLCMCNVRAGRHIDKVGTVLLEPATHRGRIINVETFRHPIGRRNAHKDRELRMLAPDGPNNLAYEPRPALK